MFFLGISKWLIHFSVEPEPFGGPLKFSHHYDLWAHDLFLIDIE